MVFMALAPTRFYREVLTPVHEKLLAHEVTRSMLSGSRIRVDGKELGDSIVELPFGTLTPREFAHMFSVFDGSRVHVQAQKGEGPDHAPPGLYFTVINNRVLQNTHKNRLGLVTEESEACGLFVEALHIDHYYLNKGVAPPALGSIAFSLCAITAHLANLTEISLIAAGGRGFLRRHVGYKVWPKLGFDGEIHPGELAAATHLAHCPTVRAVISEDPVWWDLNGSQRRMVFDLRPHSASWEALLAFMGTRLYDP
jgi:hypothetical protein